MKLLEGKVAIVTGAARGIGEGIALKFAEHGAHIVFTYVSESSAEKAKALEEKLSNAGIRAKGYKSNAADFAQCETLLNEVLKDFTNVDICVNNAGISREGGLIDLGVELGLVKKSGAFFSYGDTRLGQGREHAREFLKSNADLAGQLEGEIRRQTLTGAKYQPETPTVEAYVSALDLTDPLTLA